MECTKCGSVRVMPDVQIFDQGQYSDGHLKARIDTKPEALMFKGTITSPLRGHVCGDCGYVELFVENPAALYEAWLKRPPEA